MKFGMKYLFTFTVFIVPLLNISLWSYIIIKYSFKSSTFNQPGEENYATIKNKL